MHLLQWINAVNSQLTLEGHLKGCGAVAFCTLADKPYLASGGDDYLVKIWDYTNKHCVFTFKEHEQCVRILLADEKVKIDVNVEGVGTPLHIACKRNNFKLVSLLIFKADPKYVYTLYDICLA